MQNRKDNTDRLGIPFPQIYPFSHLHTSWCLRLVNNGQVLSCSLLLLDSVSSLPLAPQTTLSSLRGNLLEA